MRTRRKIGLGLGLVVLVLAATVMANWWLTPAGPPLRVGMSAQEVCDALQDDYDIERGTVFDYSVEFPVVPGDSVGFRGARLSRHNLGEDFLLVWYSDDGKVKGWRVHDLRPSLLDRVLKRVGL